MKTPLENICFIDSETRRVPDATIEDVMHVGGYRYAEQAFATMWTYNIGEGPNSIFALDDGFHRRLSWHRDVPDEIKEFYGRAVHGHAWFVAWNMAFDRLIWNGPESDFPGLRPDMTLDAMAQAAASGLPTKLMHASKWVRGTQKLEQGSHLIKLFEPPNGSTPQSAPQEWTDFKEYGMVDTEAMRDIWKATRPLTPTEWQDYWVSEKINDRGMGLDTRLCAAASVLVDDSQAVINGQIAELTDGIVRKVTEAKRILRWVLDRTTDPEALKPLIEKTEILSEDGDVIRPVKYSLGRERIEAVLAYYGSYDDLSEMERAIVEVLELRLYGGSTTPAKFAKALRMQNEGSLRGQYVFNGAPQTGRFSSRGVQIHNLTRSHLDELEDEAIEIITALDDKRIERRLAAAGL